MAINFELGEGRGDRVALGLVILQADETLEQEFRLFMSSDVFSLYHSRVPSGLEVTAKTLVSQGLPSREMRGRSTTLA